MKKLSPKVKKVAVLTGLGIICVGCLSLVMIHANAGENQESVSSESSAELVLGTPNPISVPPISSEATGTGSAFIPSSGATASEPLTDVSKPTSTPPKPTPPASSDLTNKSSKPSYSSKPTASKSSTQKSSKNKMGDTRVVNGQKQVYVDGFGWIENQGDGGQGTTVGSSGDQLTGNKVGTMD